jgi:hypothetical protein
MYIILGVFMHHFDPKHRVLFVLKYRQLYQDVLFNNSETTSQSKYFSSGLLNSANQVHHMLTANGVESKLVQVLDNNAIDREVHQYKPTDVIIEALWVVPEKFEVLQKLHPKVRWIIRLHSETPFMANEGIAMEWVLKYAKHKNVFIAINSPKMMADMTAIFPECHRHKLMYLPNYYDYHLNHVHTPHHHKHDDVLDIACFGAIRPLKNQLLQAMAAIRYADEMNQRLRFHINGSRIENNGNNVYKNIKSLFDNIDKHRYKLVEHEWLNPLEFRTLCSKMDIGMQVSFSETFNIVTADFVAQDVPIVVSDEVVWAACPFMASSATDINEIVKTMHRARLLGKVGLTVLNKLTLNRYNTKTVSAWLKEFK